MQSSNPKIDWIHWKEEVSRLLCVRNIENYMQKNRHLSNPKFTLIESCVKIFIEEFVKKDRCLKVVKLLREFREKLHTKSDFCKLIYRMNSQYHLRQALIKDPKSIFIN